MAFDLAICSLRSKIGPLNQQVLMLNSEKKDSTGSSVAGIEVTWAVFHRSEKSVVVAQT